LDIDGDELVLEYWTPIGPYMHLIAALELNERYHSKRNGGFSGFYG